MQTSLQPLPAPQPPSPASLPGRRRLPLPKPGSCAGCREPDTVGLAAADVFLGAPRPGFPETPQLAQSQTSPEPRAAQPAFHELPAFEGFAHGQSRSHSGLICEGVCPSQLADPAAQDANWLQTARN